MMRTSSLGMAAAAAVCTMRAARAVRAAGAFPLLPVAHEFDNDQDGDEQKNGTDDDSGKILNNPCKHEKDSFHAD